VRLDVCAEGAPAAFDGDQFALCRLLFACLEQAVACQPDGGEASLIAASEGNKFVLTIRIAAGQFPADSADAPEIAALCLGLKLSASVTEAGKALKITPAP